MTPFEMGDILLLNVFPFSNLQEAKKRPAVVLADIGDQDIVLARMTSESPRDTYDLEIPHWKDCGLLLPTCIRLSKIATLNRRLVVRKLGRLGSPDRRKVRAKLKSMFNL